MKILTNNLFMLKYVFRYVPVYAISAIIITSLMSLAEVGLFVYSFKYVIDGIQSNKSFGEILTFLLALSAVTLILALLDKLISVYYAPISQIKLNQKMQTELFTKATSIDIKCYDNPSFYNDFVWATSQADTKAMEVFETTKYMIASITVVAGIIAIIASLDSLSIIFAAISAILSLGINFLVNKHSFKLADESRPLIRKRDYTGRIFYLVEYAKEIRLSNIKSLLIKRFNDSIANIIDLNRKYSKKLIFFKLLEFIVNEFIILIAYLLILVFKVVVLKTLTLGNFSALYTGVDALRFRFMSFSYFFSDYQKHSLYIDKFLVFLNYVNEINDNGTLETPKVPTQIDVNDISFSYGENQAESLKNICLSIKPREKIAIVGYNGAGKSTLVKLLMRLYDVSDGEIRLNDVPISQYKLNDYRKNIGAVFQDYQLFACSLADNIAMGEAINDKKMQNALDKSNFLEKLSALPNGLSTKISREFDDKGTILSGGEAQKVAIARVFYTDSPLILLDEPSSALDPISEFEINETMINSTKDKTVIFISHRLSTTRMADRVYMLSNGEIIESGTHDELIVQNGAYAEMFNLQAEKYRSVQ